MIQFLKLARKEFLKEAESALVEASKYASYSVKHKNAITRHENANKEVAECTRLLAQLEGVFECSM